VSSSAPAGSRPSGFRTEGLSSSIGPGLKTPETKALASTITTAAATTRQRRDRTAPAGNSSGSRTSFQTQRRYEEALRDEVGDLGERQRPGLDVEPAQGVFLAEELELIERPDEGERPAEGVPPAKQERAHDRIRKKSEGIGPVLERRVIDTRDPGRPVEPEQRRGDRERDRDGERKPCRMCPCSTRHAPIATR
jgi:hypothetical protein